jgi:DNA-binding MarR family transcriptional regulator
LGQRVVSHPTDADVADGPQPSWELSSLAPRSNPLHTEHFWLATNIFFLCRPTYADTLEALMDSVNMKIEQQMTVLLRRVQRIHISTSAGMMDLDRSAYGIMCRLADEGPQRLGAFAAAFGLDPSTITRQVQALERAGLATRTTDEADRRASILQLTEEGVEALNRTREYRRERLEEIVSGWSDSEREQFGQLLEKFNASIDQMVERSR